MYAVSCWCGLRVCGNAAAKVDVHVDLTHMLCEALLLPPLRCSVFCLLGSWNACVPWFSGPWILTCCSLGLFQELWRHLLSNRWKVGVFGCISFVKFHFICVPDLRMHTRSIGVCLPVCARALMCHRCLCMLALAHMCFRGYSVLTCVRRFLFDYWAGCVHARSMPVHLCLCLIIV